MAILYSLARQVRSVDKGAFVPNSDVREKPLAKPVFVAYYSPPRNTKRPCKAGAAGVAGLAGRLVQQGIAALTAAKKIAAN
ncbi:hypothetical protein QO239_13820, partial [Cupriavidus taiwanensis]|uniref:hypothetical protein n=1 Tax=Cupriavidus taiwanensis TaxID=164546 RepID=UPI0025418EE8